MKRTVLLVALAALSGCATRAPFTHTQVGVSGDKLFADTTTCKEMARTGGQPPSGSTPHNPALGSQAGAALGAGFAQGLAQGQAQRAAYERCMSDRGYLQTTLTPDENTAFRALKTEEERKAWLADFSSKDHGERSVRLPETPPCTSNALVTCADPG